MAWAGLCLPSWPWHRRPLVKSRRFRLRGLGSRRFRLRGLGFDDPWKSLGFRVSGEERVERCHAIITNVGLKAKI